MKLLGVTARQEEPGVWRMEGGAVVHRMWLLETDVLAGAPYPLLTVFSPQVRRDVGAVYDSLTGDGYNEIISYICQQIILFRMSGKEFAMHHLGAETEMPATLGELLKRLPMEDRLRFTLHDPLLMKELLHGLPLKERLQGLSAEERLEGLTPQERERMRKLLHEPGAEKANSG